MQRLLLSKSEKEFQHFLTRLRLLLFLELFTEPGALRKQIQPKL